MPRTAIVAVSRRGAALARRLAAVWPAAALHIEQHFAEPGDGAAPFALPLRPVVQRLFGEVDRLALFLPVGAAVRLLAPRLGDKGSDPAVVCVDDAGRFAVSLLSGHVGGADQLAQEVAAILGATPVITTASHVMQTLAVDLLGREFGWQVEADKETVTRASAAVVNGDPVGVFQEAGERRWWPADAPLPSNIVLCPSLEVLAASSCVAALVVTDKLAPPSAASYAAALPGKQTIVYRPRSLAAGLGCRRGVPLAELDTLLRSAFAQSNLELASLRCLASADVKRDEPGLIALAEKYGIPFHCYSAEELNAMFDPADLQALERRESLPPRPPGRLLPTPSAAPRRLLGVWGVAEPAALLAANSQELLVSRQQSARATIAIARYVV